MQRDPTRQNDFVPCRTNLRKVHHEMQIKKVTMNRRLFHGEHCEVFKVMIVSHPLIGNNILPFGFYLKHTLSECSDSKCNQFLQLGLIEGLLTKIGQLTNKIISELKQRETE